MLVVRVLCEACDFILFDSPEGVRRNPFLRLREVLDASGGDAILAIPPVITRAFCHSNWARHPCFPFASEAKLTDWWNPSECALCVDRLRKINLVSPRYGEVIEA